MVPSFVGKLSGKDRYRFNMAGVGEHIDWRHADHAITALGKKAQVALLRIGIAADVDDTARRHGASGLDKGESRACAWRIERQDIDMLAATCRVLQVFRGIGLNKAGAVA